MSQRELLLTRGLPAGSLRFCWTRVPVWEGRDKGGRCSGHLNATIQFFSFMGRCGFSPGVKANCSDVSFRHRECDAKSRNLSKRKQKLPVLLQPQDRPWHKNRSLSLSLLFFHSSLWGTPQLGQCLTLWGSSWSVTLGVRTSSWKTALIWKAPVY